MNKKNSFALLTLMLIAVLGIFTSCKSDDPTPTPTPVTFAAEINYEGFADSTGYNVQNYLNEYFKSLVGKEDATVKAYYDIITKQMTLTVSCTDQNKTSVASVLNNFDNDAVTKKLTNIAGVKTFTMKIKDTDIDYKFESNFTSTGIYEYGVEGSSVCEFVVTDSIKDGGQLSYFVYGTKLWEGTTVRTNNVMEFTSKNGSDVLKLYGLFLNGNNNLVSITFTMNGDSRVSNKAFKCVQKKEQSTLISAEFSLVDPNNEIDATTKDAIDAYIPTDTNVQNLQSMLPLNNKNIWSAAGTEVAVLISEQELMLDILAKYPSLADTSNAYISVKVTSTTLYVSPIRTYCLYFNGKFIIQG